MDTISITSPSQMFLELSILIFKTNIKIEQI